MIEVDLGTGPTSTNHPGNSTMVLIQVPGEEKGTGGINEQASLSAGL